MALPTATATSIASYNPHIYSILRSASLFSLSDDTVARLQKLHAHYSHLPSRELQEACVDSVFSFPVEDVQKGTLTDAQLLPYIQSAEELVDAVVEQSIPDLSAMHLTEFSPAERSARLRASASPSVGPVPFVVPGFGGGGDDRAVNSDQERQRLEHWHGVMKQLDDILAHPPSMSDLPLLDKGDLKRTLPDSPSAAGVEEKTKSVTHALMMLHKDFEQMRIILKMRVQRHYDSAVNAVTNLHEYEQHYLRGLLAKVETVKRRNDYAAEDRANKLARAEENGRLDYIEKVRILDDKSLKPKRDEIKGQATNFIDMVRAQPAAAAPAAASAAVAVQPAVEDEDEAMLR